MSDKSFGDCPSRNIVKNPLLSTAVTGLSIEDLTHNAVLVPVAANQGLITRSDHQIGANNQPLMHSDHEFINFPSGDSNTNVFSPQTTNTAYPHPLDHQQPSNLDKKPELTSATVSKAASKSKSDDDFDVNEYFARLHGTRYVSAPINSNPDQNANLAETEENLEEISLSDDTNKVETQQSFAEDIAQNFSQLPTVLPHVASAVFSSFSNMLNYKSREQTPDEKPPSYEDAMYQSQTLGPSFSSGPVERELVLESVVKEVAPPPKEPPVCGASNFRISTKKKYAQIPGLSTGHIETSQPMAFNPLTRNVPSYFVPTIEDNKNETEIPKTVKQENNITTEQKTQNTQVIYNMFNPVDDLKETASESEPKNFTNPKETTNIEERLPPPPSYAGPSTAIPPPPMFSTQKRDSQSGKSVLPPSVARRIGSNHPVIKPQIMHSINTENIFVPTFDPASVPSESAQPTFSEPSSQSSFGAQMFATNQPTSQPLSREMPLMPTSLSNIPPPAQFTTQSSLGFSKSSAPTSSIIAPPVSNKPPPQTSFPSTMPPRNISGPLNLFPANTPAMFIPSADAKSNTGPESSLPLSSTIFSPTSPAQSLLIPGPTPQPIGSAPNVASSLFAQQAVVAPPPLYSSDIEQTSEPPKPVIEPPKSTGALNFRMNKKKPQYYSGPIEGVGSISNSIKPVIQPVESGTFQGALFTPAHQSEQNVTSSTPFDISKPLETVPLVPQYNAANHMTSMSPSTAFDFPQPAPVPYDINPALSHDQYNTAFDFSRPNTENYGYNEDSSEPKGFGIIGSLKSKLSNIDINKIQQSVTTFFDPTYNDTKKDDVAAEDTAPSSSMSYHTQGTQSDLEIFVPPNLQAQRPVYENNQYNNFPNQGQAYAGPSSHYNQYQTYPNMYTQTYSGMPTNTNIYLPEATSFYTQDNVVIEKGTNKTATSSEDATIPKTIQTQTDISLIKSNINVIGPKPAVVHSGKGFFDMASTTKGIDDEKIAEVKLRDTASQVALDNNKMYSSKDATLGSQEPQIESSLFEAKPDNLFANLTETNEMFANKAFNDKERLNISYGAQVEDLFGSATTDNNKIMDDNAMTLFAAKPEFKAMPLTQNNELKSDNIFTRTMFGDKVEDKKTILKDSILKSLNKDDVPILGVSSVPLFGLSTITADTSSDFSKDNENMRILDIDRSSSLSFFDNVQKTENRAPIQEDINKNTSFSFFENLTTPVQKNEEYNKSTDNKTASSFSYFDEKKNDSPVSDEIELDLSPGILDKVGTATPDDIENISELSICETCREVNKPEDKECDDQDLTTQLIENITSPIQLLNPVEASLPEADIPDPSTTDDLTFDEGYLRNMENIIDDAVIETFQAHSATGLLDNDDEKDLKHAGVNYGWTDEEVLKPEYSFNIDPNSIGLFGNKSIFFDKIPANADDVKHNKDLLAKHLHVPSAPPAEEDSKSDEATLDVNSIEQDANKDFPLFEEFVIEPETEDETEYKEKPKEDTSMDSFTNRVERYKNTSDYVEGPRKLFFDIPPHPINMASYFDTGNYAAENYYRNTNTMPSTSIPPGFEEEFRKRMKIAIEKEREANLKEELRTIPDTSTQTRTTVVLSYSSASSVPSYSCSPSMPVGFNVEANITSIVDDLTEPDEQESAEPTTPKLEEITESKLPDPMNFFTAEPTTPKQEEKTESKLPDPMNFFTDNVPTEAPENFNRLASYFSSPPKTEHAKSFFELSQSQNHYRHASENKYYDLMKDLTSPENLTVPKEQTIRHVNYFTVEYDTILPEFFNSKGDTGKVELVDNDTDTVDLDRLVTNCRYCAKILGTNFKVRSANDYNNESGSGNSNMDTNKDTGRGSVTVNFDDGVALHEEPNEGVAGMTENRSATEYTPVKHHWFYRVDVEDKSIWRGFSVVDSRALEAAYLDPELNDQTLVATDGGRYDVNIMGRLRIPVYWTDKPTNVRRCSWFYKGTTDARYVPYTEPTAEKLEEEYRHGMTTGDWHRRLVLPNGEVVVMHGPSVMVHFLHSDAFSTPPLFSFGKRVYRNPPKIRLSRDQPEKIDHLILLVHGAGEYKCQKEKNQSSSRPRVVRRGHDESEIEDTEPSSIDHLLLLCHGVGSACDMRFRSVEEVVEDFRATSLQLLQSHYRNSYDQGIVSRVEVLPISWHATLHSGETGVDRRLSQITLDSIPRLRSFTNDTVLDVLFYTSPVFCQTIINTVCMELNRIYQLFIQRNPSFKGGVSLGGHSLGSVILYDLLCHQADATNIATDDSKSQADKHYVGGPAGTGQPSVQYPSLAFAPDALYALGSPIAIFECIRGVESLGASFSLPTCKNFFNIFHPYDPIAYRIEPLINPRLRELKPLLIPHHKGRKRMHLELKDTMARVGADLKQKLLESLKSTWNKWKTQPPTDGQLEKVVEEEIEKEHLCDENTDEFMRESELSTPEMLGHLNGGRRVDYVLQEAPLEMINEYLFAMSSHVGYWESEDTMLLMLREIYSALGVQPDSTVPQQNMTVQRTRNTRPDDTIIVNASSEFPSTSHGSI